MKNKKKRQQAQDALCLHLTQERVQTPRSAEHKNMQSHKNKQWLGLRLTSKASREVYKSPLPTMLRVEGGLTRGNPKEWTGDL